jgi:hypothetical protein
MPDLTDQVQSNELPDLCPYCGASHTDGDCRICGGLYCGTCLSADRTCPNCDGRADEDLRNP